MSARLCFVAPPFAGHLNPLVPLAEAARDAGFAVEILTGPAKVDVLRARGLTADTLACLAPGALEAVSDTTVRVGSDPVRLWRQMRAALALLAPARAELVSRWARARPDLVIADFAAVPAGLAAQALSIPWITLLRPPFVLETGAGPPSYLGGWRPAPGPLGRMRDRLGWALVGAVKDGLFALSAAELEAAGLPRRRRADGSEAIYSPLMMLSTTMSELEFTHSWPAHIRFIGPNAENPERTAPLELPDGGPRVLVTMGTHLHWTKHDLAARTERLARRLPGVRFVVSLGDASRASPAPMEVRGPVSVFAFVPYVAELPRFAAVIHHAGAGITYAAIEAGRPALAHPQDYDQFDFAARLEHFGLGRRLRRLDTGETARLVAQALEGPQCAHVRFAAAARAYRPKEAFLAAVREALERA